MTPPTAVLGLTLNRFHTLLCFHCWLFEQLNAAGWLVPLLISATLANLTQKKESCKMLFLWSLNSKNIVLQNTIFTIKVLSSKAGKKVFLDVPEYHLYTEYLVDILYRIIYNVYQLPFAQFVEIQFSIIWYKLI